jgi:thioredoxin 1
VRGLRRRHEASPEELRREIDRSGVTRTDQTFETRVLEGRQPMLAGCMAEGGGRRQMLAPAIAALAGTCGGRVTVATLDVDAEPQTAERAGWQTLPAVRCFEEGPVVEPLTRVVDRAGMAAALHPLTGTSQA